MKKTAIVTGATGGIGLATAKELVASGFLVIAMGTRANFEAPEGVVYVRGSITEAADRKRVLDTALELGGRVDVLVNVSGVAPLKRCNLLEMSEESYDVDLNEGEPEQFHVTMPQQYHMTWKTEAKREHRIVVQMRIIAGKE